jgi:hypothetical protein
VKTFTGFPARGEFTAVPNALFSQLLPEIDDTNELKETLGAIAHLYRTNGYPQFVSQAELAADIRSTGFFNNKAKSLIGAAKKVVADFGGKVPRTMEEMLTMPGAARKTANVVLGTAYGVASGVVVDTTVQYSFSYDSGSTWSSWGASAPCRLASVWWTVGM